jgi:AsmA protein
MRKLWIVSGTVAAAIVVILIILPFLVNADRFRPQVESQMQAALGRRVQIGQLALSIWHGGVAASDVSVADDPAYSQIPFLKAKSIGIGVDLLPLIFSKSLTVNSVTIEEPEVRLLRASNGTWNYSTIGTSAATRAAGPEQSKRGRRAKTEPRSESAAATNSSSPSLSIGRLRIVDGRIVVSHAGTRPKPSTYEHLNLTAKNVGYGSKIPFSLEMETPGGGKLTLDGTAGPIERADAARTPLEAKVKISDMNLASTGVIDPSAGIAGTLRFSGTAESDGKVARSQGKATVDGLKLVKGGGPAKQPVSLDYAAEYEPQQQAGTMRRGDIHFGTSTAHLTGRFDTRGESTSVHMKLNGKSLPVSDVQGLLPALGVILPSGSSLQGGTADANLSLDGPIDRMVTSGTVDVQNARLAGFDLARKMSTLSALAGLRGGQDTMIQLMSSNLRIAPEGIRTEHLNLVVANLGQITGDGTIGTNNALNLKMLAKLSSANSIFGGVSEITSLGRSKGSIPFLITGTTQNPIFLPDVGRAMVGTAAAPAEGVGKILGGFFGRKK